MEVTCGKLAVNLPCDLFQPPLARIQLLVQVARCYTVKNVVYRNTPGEQYFTVSMVTHTVTTETVKYCSPGVFSYTTFFTV